ncbi:26.2 kDa heat shock protein, mitochondrial-like [Triticum dicoccoides]|uniref:26.2 kDa heat shock protein, mitochondrial-like n=1 Tax=Triticum dicoccoides TaxID=85692 RepID=UPI000E7C8D57|nr:26.2 kDa heat shock protein, mitochondrial-like [Triticum dicoccoides]
MASAVDCKGKEIAPASLLKSGAPVAFRSVHSPAVTAARRPYNTQAKEVSRYDDDDDDYSGRDLVIPSFFSQDVLDPLGAPTSMARLLSLMEDVASQTGLSSTAAGAGASRLGRWVAKEDDDAVYLKVPMPGLTKEHVEVRADKNILMIKGEGEKQPWDGDDDDSAVPKYNRRIEVSSAHAYKMDKIRAEMKNGVLWVTLLKVKEEERKDVFHVKVE